MSALADVRPMTVDQVLARLDEIEVQFRDSGLTVAEAQRDRYALTAAERAEIDEYEDLALIVSDET